ncbi:hypothetical protein T4D_6334 [Trichinella pseudospiralis]|uniref:Uncharacterized protein n=1 Tax=Trichinella pseudospiralis TaxID=6337 RepID=A0A0V1FWX0_TRIPS|nr:hypothetical protein T4D_6334 [Trichinella pseudospiralis]
MSEGYFCLSSSESFNKLGDCCCCCCRFDFTCLFLFIFSAQTLSFSRMKSSQTVHKARFFLENEVAKKQNFKYNKFVEFNDDAVFCFVIFYVKTHTRDPQTEANVLPIKPRFSIAGHGSCE